jgi:hypothetical protein
MPSSTAVSAGSKGNTRSTPSPAIPRDADARDAAKRIRGGQRLEIAPIERRALGQIGNVVEGARRAGQATEPRPSCDKMFHQAATPAATPVGHPRAVSSVQSHALILTATGALRRDAFRKSIFAKPQYLIEDLVRETFLIALRACRRSIAAERARGPLALPGRHRAAQPIRFSRGKAGRHDGQLHDLLLENRHAQVRFSTASTSSLGYVTGSSPLRRRRYGCTISPWMGPGRTMATSITRS